MKLLFSIITTLTISLKASAMVLIQYDKNNLRKKSYIENYLLKEMNIPKKLIKIELNDICTKNDHYDIVICLNKKNGEKITFPTVKNFLIKNKYDEFKKN